MDMKKQSKNNLWKYLLGVGAGLGVGYLAYKAFFSKGRKNNELTLDSLSRYEAEQRSSILTEVKYNLSLKMKHSHDDLSVPLHHQKAPIKGVVEIEFNLLQVKDLSLEFSGFILDLSRSVGEKDQKIKFTHDKETKKILIDQSNLALGKNKLVINFCVKECEKGIVYSDQIYFTDFQPFGAHHLFPCFDQPDLKSEINLLLAVPKSMEAFGVTDHSIIDINYYSENESARNQLENSLEITNRDEFKFLQFKPTPKLPLYSFFFCAGDLQAYEFTNEERKIVQRIIVPKNRNDIAEETKNTIFSFTEVFLQHFQKSVHIDYFPCEFINHIFLPHAIEMREKSLDNFCNIIYPDVFIDKLKNRNEFLFFLTLIGKSLINQIYGHAITLKWWDDFWFKESLSIYLAYDFNYKISQIDIQDKKAKKEIINTFNEIEELKDTWSLFIKFNSKAYTFDRNNRKNHPVIKELDNTEEVYKIKDEMTYCKGPQVLKYMSYVLGEEIFFNMVKNFISTFKDTSATFEDFLSMIDKSVDAGQEKDLKAKVAKIKEDFLQKTCPPVFGFEVELDEKRNLKKIAIRNETITGIDNNPSSLETDVLLVYLNKSSDYGEVTYKLDKFYKVDITSEQSINNTFKTVSSKPDFVLLNHTDQAYLIQKFTEDQCEWLVDNVTIFKDPLIVSIIVRNLVMMTYNSLFSPRKMIKLLIDLLIVKNNIFNIDYFLKTITFLINDFVSDPLHQGQYKLLLFETITDTLAKTESLNSLYNVFIRHLIDCTDRNNKEELVKLIEYISYGHIPKDKLFSRRSSGVVNMAFNEFEVNDLLKLPDNLSEKITKENLKRLLILILESEAIEEDCSLVEESDSKDKGNEVRHVTKIKTLRDVKDVLIHKFYKDHCSGEIKTKVETILNPLDAWNKIAKISNSKSYLSVYNWILERLLKPRQLEKLGNFNYNHETFFQIVENSVSNDNLKFLERFLKYSEGTLPPNEETINLYYRCSKLVERFRNNKNEKQVEKILHMIFNIHNHVLKKIDNIEKYETLWSAKDDNFQNSLDNSQTYAN